MIQIISVLVVAKLLVTRSFAAEPDFVIVGYLPDYRIAECRVEQLFGVTDLVYFSLTPNAEGAFPDDSITDATLKKLHEFKQQLGCRLLITVGGWDRSQGFAKFATDDVKRKQFVDNLAAFCRGHQFDGVDYDWEHPETAAEVSAYDRLLVETSERFHREELLVTTAQAGWQHLDEKTYETIDRVHLMAYDHDFPQATLEKVRNEVDALIKRGCPSAKIALGLPFYGRNSKGEARTYGELMTVDNVDVKSDLINGYAFNGISTIRAKIEYASKKKLAGVMIWELGQDAADEKLSLLAVIRRSAVRREKE